jgi:N-acetylglucosaminyldiphosphoundecaprenol N-acetyl-beta-D-mannosaminyltransferase
MDVVGLSTPEQFFLLGSRVDNLTMQDTLDRLIAWAAQGQSRQISFVNAHCLNVAYYDSAYLKILNESDLVLADGSGVRMGAEANGIKVKDNVNGTDMFPLLCQRLQKEPLGLFILGAAPGVAEDVAKWAETNYPGIRIAGINDGFFNAQQEEAVLAKIRDSKATIVLVAMGVPRQELWIDSVLTKIPGTVCLGVGGLLDFYSGRVSRAPRWLRAIGQEWVWRLLQEPSRMWKRYLVGNLLFLWRVRRHRFSTAPRYRSGEV